MARRAACGAGKGTMLGRLAGEAARAGWSLLREDLSLPAAVLSLARLQGNVDWMQRFADAYGVQLAPHGKTTMAPRLFAMQLERGAWGMTLATVQQVQAAHGHGVRRVLMANQLVGRANMEAVSRLLEDPGFEFYCLVDSAEGAELLGAFFRDRGQRLRVLLEVGVEGGRSGVRSESQRRSTLQAIESWPDALRLWGVEVYEGVLRSEAEVRALLERTAAITREMLAERRFAADRPLLSAAGSAWYDVAAEILTRAGLRDAVSILLRPGCSLIHDVGDYAAAQARAVGHDPVAAQLPGALKPALKIWAYVQSRPEPGLAIVGMGKRDAAFDSGLPVPALVYRPQTRPQTRPETRAQTRPQTRPQARPQTKPGAGPQAAARAAADARTGMATDAPRPTPEHWRLTRMMDQHAFLEIHDGDDLRVGDMLGFDIVHPCLAFDKWRVMAVVDEQYRVLEMIETWF